MHTRKYAALSLLALLFAATPAFAVNAPTVTGPATSTTNPPTWTWVSGGGGNGTFRWQLDDAVFPGAGMDTGTQTSYTPAPFFSSAARISTGGHHLLALQSDGIVVAWGNNVDGQATVPGGLTNVIAIATSLSYSLALKSDGTVVGWGDNSSGQITMPVGLVNVVAIAASYDTAYALKSDGTVVGWGGDSGATVAFAAGLSDVTAIAAGAMHLVALKADGTVVSGGANFSGQTDVPAGLTGVIAIAADGCDGGHTVALKSNGTVVAWGDNTYGQSTVPGSLTGVTAISAGSGHTLALKSNGALVAWGNNADGQRTIPAGLTSVRAISAGSNHNLALKNDGTVVFWGWAGDSEGSVPAGLNLLADQPHTLYVEEGDGVGGWSAAGTATIAIAASANRYPTINAISNVVINQDTATGSTAITVGDLDGTANLVVTATSSDTTLIPNASLAITGSGTTWALVATPVVGQYGVSTITVTVSDTLLTASTTYTVTVNAVNQAPVNVAYPGIIGTNTVGQLLTAQNGVWSDHETAAGSLVFTYQWWNATDSLILAGATSSTYTVQAGDAGKALGLQVFATDGGYGPVAAATTSAYAHPFASGDTAVFPAVTSTLTAVGVVGSAFSYQITGSNSPNQYNAINLPAGLIVNTGTGVISGTPTTAGVANATITVTNTAGSNAAVLAITISAGGGSGGDSSSGGGGGGCSAGGAAALLLGCMAFIGLRRRNR